MTAKFNYKQNDLFRRGLQIRLNACVGPNGGPYDFADYARGYFLAARELVDSLEKESNYVDILVYPLCYAYRHAVELGLKHLARELPRLYGDKKEIQLTHNLNDNWQQVRPYLTRARRYLDADSSAIPYVDKVLADFLDFDPSGEVFRFPENKKGERHLQDTRIINVEVLGTYMNKLADIFEFWFYKSRELMEHRHDMQFDT